MQLATEQRFNGTWYTKYRHHKGFAKRAQLLISYPEPILIIGCGFGYLIVELELLGKVAKGLEASDWAVQNRVRNSVKLGSALDVTKISLQAPFASIVTEDLLPCLTDAEVLTLATNCASFTIPVLHLVTEQGAASELNYRPRGEWAELTGQQIMSLEGM
jgi:hypothetical protein